MGWLRSLVLRILAATLVSLFAFWLQIDMYFDLPEADQLIEQNATFTKAFFSDALGHAESTFDAAADTYVWGRTTSPHFSMDLHDVNWVMRYLQQKEFVWLSVTSGDWLIGIAVLQFHYMSTLTMQVLRVGRGDGDAIDGTGVSTVRSLRGRLDVPLLADVTHTGGVWLANDEGRMGPAAAGHTVRFLPPPWSRSPSYVNLTFTGSTIEVSACAVVQDAPRPLAVEFGAAESKRAYVVELNATARMPAEWMGLVFPLGPQRPAAVQKMAAVPLVRPARLRIAPQNGDMTDPLATETALKNGFLAMDYTRGVLRRHTEWYWASLCAPSGVGLHLSAGTYDVRNVSMESTIFDASAGDGGKAYFLNEAVHFTRLPTTRKVQWAIRSENETVSLVFTSRGGHDGAVNLRVVKVNLDHQWGTFRGKIRVGDKVVLLEDVPGVFEEHFALW